MRHGMFPRLVSALCLAGITLLIVGLFPPWIIKITYYTGAFCSGGSCPKPTIYSRSLWELLVVDASPFTPGWWLAASLTLVPLLLVLVLQGEIARTGLIGRGSRRLVAFGLICAVVVTAYYLYGSWAYYCLFYAGCAATPGPWAAPGERILAPGFWLMLTGFLIAIGSDITLLARAPHPHRRDVLSHF